MTFKIFLVNAIDEGNEIRHNSLKLAHCQRQALRTGTEMADYFNALPPNEFDTLQRIHQDFIIQHLGFAPWITEALKDSKSYPSGQTAEHLQRKGGWMEEDLQKSHYSILENKWIYFFGDSTLRQVWASYAAPFQQGGQTFERNSKVWTRENCAPQENRPRKHQDFGTFDEEGWRGRCGLNERTCHVSGYGKNGKITNDWKHFPYEDYDDYLFTSEKAPFKIGFESNDESIQNNNQKNQRRRPDLFVIQTGLHTCYHAYPEGPMSTHLTEPNVTLIQNHKQDIWKLMATIRTAIDTRLIDEEQPTETTVIVLTSGYEYQHERMDRCIQYLNRVTTEAARSYGFAVLDRSEIERRWMVEAMYAENPYFAPNIHLGLPVQNIIATLLLQLYHCIHASGLSKSEYNENMKKKYPLLKQIALRNWNMEQVANVV